MTAEADYKVLAGKHGYADSHRYQRVLEYLMTPQQAKLATLLPGTLEELSVKLGIEVDIVKQELDRLFQKGVVFTKNFDTMESCRFAGRPGELQDACTMTALNGDSSHLQELFELWEDFNHEEREYDLTMSLTRPDKPLTRIVPAYESIKDNPQILPYEDVRQIIKAQSSIAAVACPCRQRKKAVGKTCNRFGDGACIHFGHSVDYIVNRGLGARLSVEEAFQLVDEAEEYGLVHTWINYDSMFHRIPVLCNCCVDCCVVLAPTIRFQGSPVKVYAKSRYEASADQDMCIGCQECVERCPFDAVDMVKPEGTRVLKALVNSEKCMGCGVCVVGCETEALTMKLVRPAEHIPQLEDAAQLEIPWF